MILLDRLTPAPRSPALEHHRGPLALTNLLNDLETLARLIRGELARGAWLDAFLLAAGINQIVEDYLHRDPFSLTKVAKHLARLPGPAGKIAGGSASAAGELVWRLRNRGRRTMDLIRWQADFGRFVQRLGQMASCSALRGCVSAAELEEQYEVLLDNIGDVPEALRREVLRLPASFRSFDQRPEDLQRIAESFANGWPDRTTPLLVAGVRTSGSYLAPLLAAELTTLGYESVTLLTLRPGQRLLPSERELVRSIAAGRGRVLITDEPPTSGQTVAEVARQFVRAGVQQASVVLCFQLFGGYDSLPPLLAPYESVLLPEDEWSIQSALNPESIWTNMTELLAGEAEILAVDRLTLPLRSRQRSHVRGLYRVLVRMPATGEHAERLIYAKGAGLGYFAQQALAVAAPLVAHLPRIYGLRSGVLMREWLPEQRHAEPPEVGQESNLAQGIALYIAARAEALAVVDDTSLRLVNRAAVWQRASDLLARGFGRAAPVARAALHASAKQILAVRNPAVMDGAMERDRWFLDESGSSLLKTNFADRVFSNRDMHCFDPVMDLAAAAVAAPRLPAFSAQLRRAYEQIAGRIDDERWFLYQVLQLQEEERRAGREDAPIRRELARLSQQYYAEGVLDLSALRLAGPLCAIDIDGVLETSWLGFSSTTPAGALSLRALIAHGYSPILASGRSLDEVRERCLAFGIAGGVAEYGAAIYVASTDKVRVLLGADEMNDLAALRQALLGISGVCLDDDYQFSARAYGVRDGVRRSLPAEIVSAALSSSGMNDRLRAVVGERQTDFVPVGVNKGAGVAILAAQLGATGCNISERPLAFAVGDTIADLPVFQLASIAAAPANADRAVRESRARLMTRPYQSGLLQAVALLLGHRPGDCERCEFEPLDARRALLLRALSAQDAGRWGKLGATLELAQRVHA